MATALWGGPAAAQTVGDRAIGMGGAYTALSDDLSSLWYNPAGLVNTPPVTVSGSASAYQVRVDRIDEATVFHEKSGATKKGLQASSINVFPSTLLYGQRWGDEGLRHSLALGVLLPVSDRSQGSAQFSNARGGFQRTFRFSNQVQEWVVGPAYAVGTPRLSVGASALLKLYDREYDYDLFQEIQVPGRFHSVTARVFSEIYRHLAFVPSIGVRWSPSDSLRLGLLASAPGLPLWGEANVNRAVTVAGPLSIGGDEQRLQEHLHAEPGTHRDLPWRLVVGIGWDHHGAWAAEVDVEVTGEASPALDRDAVLPNSTELEHDLLQRRLGLNGRLGLEWMVAPGWALRSGVYTRKTHHPGFPAGRANPSAAGDRHSNAVGLNMALGVDGEGGRATSYGINIVRGQGEALAFHASRPIASDGQTLLGEPLTETWAEPTDYRWWEVTAVVSGVVGKD